MVWSANEFIGAPNGSFLKGPSSDDDIELFISEVEGDGVDDSISLDQVYYITDEEVYDADDTSYVDDTYDEDEYYFSDADDDDYVVNDDLYVDDTDTDSDDTDRDPVCVRLVSDSESTSSDKSTAVSSTQPLDPSADSATND